MYYSHFGLKEPPFKITPNTDFFFSGGNRGAVLDALVYSITNGEGIVKVVGEVGSGKTMLCRILQRILPERIESIYLANPSVAPEDVLHAIAFELQLKLPKNADRFKVMQQLQAHLLARHAEGRQVVIFVEEAQGMPLATLEEIRLLSNLETKQDKLLQIVLFGQPELDENLNQTHIRQLRERITHSFHLGPLQTKEVGEYLIFRLRAAGYNGPHLFSDSAIKKLSKAAEGLVRRVNILADKALLAAYADNLYLVTPKQVKAAIHDSEFGVKLNRKKNTSLWTGTLIVLLVILLIYMGWQQYITVYSANGVKSKTQDNKTQLNATKLNPIAQIKPSVLAPVAPSAPTNTINTVTSKAITTPASPQDSITPPPVNSNATTLTARNVYQPQVASNPSETITNKPADKPLIAESLVIRRLEVSKNWLFSGQPSTITLQIKSLPTGNPAQEQQLQVELDKISQLLEIDNIYLYQKKQNGELFTVVLYGAYTQRSEALDALSKLPNQIKSNRPYLRTLGGINKDIQLVQ